MNTAARDILVNQLKSEREKNAQLSLRAFARKLNFDPGALSNLLSGKKRITPLIAARLIKNLELNSVEKQRFLESVWTDYENRILDSLRDSKASLFSTIEEIEKRQH